MFWFIYNEILPPAVRKIHFISLMFNLCISKDRFTIGFKESQKIIKIKSIGNPKIIMSIYINKSIRVAPLIFTKAWIPLCHRHCLQAETSENLPASAPVPTPARSDALAPGALLAAKVEASLDEDRVNFRLARINFETIVIIIDLLLIIR